MYIYTVPAVFGAAPLFFKKDLRAVIITERLLLQSGHYFLVSHLGITGQPRRVPIIVRQKFIWGPMICFQMVSLDWRLEQILKKYLDTQILHINWDNWDISTFWNILWSINLDFGRCVKGRYFRKTRQILFDFYRVKLSTYMRLLLKSGH